MAENIDKMENTEAEVLKVEQKPFDDDDGVQLANQEEEEVKLKAEEDMKPWEQHSAVISIPRFDYNAPSSILNHSHSGFLVTCPIKREKSATKEAMLIFEKYFSFLSDLIEDGKDEGSGDMDAKMSTKRRRICGSTEHELGNDTETKDGKCVQPGSHTGTKTSDNEISSSLSLVKLIRSGLLLFVFPKDGGHNVVDIVSKIILSRESGSLKSLQWCHRIFPIQATCNLEERELYNVVLKLVQQFLTDGRNKVAGPVKFAVGYSRRGIEENEMKHVHQTSSDSNRSALLDRNKCFSTVAAAVKEVIPESVVDLKCPEIAVLVEVLPLSGIPNERVVVGVSVLPQTLVSVKPRLCIKALVHDSNEKIKK